jgi:small subunit ribosomal protein S17
MSRGLKPSFAKEKRLNKNMGQENLKTKTAVVTGKSGSKSIKVAIDYTIRHLKYGKVIRRKGRLSVHDEKNQAAVGDVVKITEARPYSKTKTWRLVKIVKKQTSQ